MKDTSPVGRGSLPTRAVPLYFVQLGVVSILTGYEIDALRMDSVVWGVVLILSCYFLVAGLTRDRLTAALTLILLACNYDIMNMGSGRQDIMCAGLAMAGLACYVWWRERHLIKAVLLAHSLIAAASMTHPYGLFGLVGFSILFAMLDLRRLTLRLVLIAALPWGVALGAWGLYIAQNPAEFVKQITTNGKGRISAMGQPLEAFVTEIRVRYLQAFAGFRPDVPVYMRIKILLLLAYAAGFAGCLLTRSIRQDKRKLALVVFGLVSACLLTFVESQRLYNYMIHVLPIYLIVLAIWVGCLVRRGPLWDKLVIAAIVLFCIYTASVVAYRAWLNEYRSLYKPTLEFLANNVRGNDLVMGPPEFGTRLGFREHCLDDETLGFRNRLTPTFVVIDRDFANRESQLQQYNPPAFSHVRSILDQSDLVFQRGDGRYFYRVYRVRTQR